MNHPHPAVQRAYEKLAYHAADLDADLLTCDRCGHDMVVRATQVSENPCRNDIRIKCPTTDDPLAPEHGGIAAEYGISLDGCGWWTRHGIPISREEYEMEMEHRERPFVDAVNTPIPEHAQADDRPMIERLRGLGYLDK